MLRAARIVVMVAVVGVSALGYFSPPDACNPPCKNGGLCRTSSRTCFCTYHFKGEDCSKRIDWCSPSPCSPQEDCRRNSFHPKGYECIKKKLNPCCGKPCQESEHCVLSQGAAEGYKCLRDPCTEHRCENNGTCTFRTPGQCETILGCNCSPPFDPASSCYFVRGENCHPTEKPCQNGGICTDDFKCSCPPGFEGNHCGHAKNVQTLSSS